ncbi:hypothetical protein Salat_0718300 [Sesamum alatum]|uniref:F-box domain-containing protein n=1 Tax=Sesamum alatum TaxID=300844 RepID=A0AAE1YT24_9LAMI|nr:hypothetical protein Salat_0718300 [Sesamum alatum]
MPSTRNGGRGEDRKGIAPEEAGNGVSQLSLMELPTAVLHEIFFKLPVNSIMKAKFVCTGLYKMLSDPEFAVNYTKNSPFTTILLCPEPFTRFGQIPVYRLMEISENYECFRTPSKLQIPGGVDAQSRLSLQATCDGLICFILRNPTADITHICNPFTGDSLVLPQHKTKHGERFSLVYGLGFCQSANKYKVLGVTYNRAQPAGSGQGEILTIGIDDRWRSLAILEVPVPSSLFNMTSVNGVLHWFLLAGHRNTCLYNFDLGEERLGQTPNPPGVVLDLRTMRLISLSSQLCLVDTAESNMIVLWKMKEHKSGQSWTKDIILCKSFPADVRFNGLMPLTVTRNGDIIFSYSWHDFVVSYNPEEKTCNKIEVFESERIAYTPSLLSVKELIRGRHWSNMNVLSN